MSRPPWPRKAPPPKGWRPRALVSDVDGTLTDKSRRLDLQAVDALRQAEAAGVPVVLATGNVLPIVYSLAYFVGTTGPIVAENGGLVLWRGQLDRLVDAAAAERAADEVERRLGLKRLFTDQWRLTEVAYPEGPTTLEDVTRVVGEAGLTAAVRIERTGFAVHLMAPESSKFRGVEHALRAMELSPDDVLAVGDSDNDQSMITGCRVGVATGDASQGLKEVADFVAQAPRGAGILEALARYGVLVSSPATGASRGARASPTSARPSRRRAIPRGSRASRARPATKRAAAVPRNRRR
jgi:hypothetical protein